MKGVDYSFARPGAAAIKAAGYDFVLRYVPYPGDGGKGLDAAELADLRANGLAVGLVFESTAERHLGGFNAGVADAWQCNRSILDLNFPDRLPVYFAVDFDAQPSHWPLIDAYQAGAISVLGLPRVGIYGSYSVVEHAHEANTAAWYWQCRAWSGTPVQMSPWRHLYQTYPGGQINGGDVDFNEAFGADQGLWMPEGVNVPDPRLDAVIAALGGQAAIDAWNGPADKPTGNSLLLGYAGEQQKLGTLTARVDEHIQNHAAGVGPPVPEHMHIQGGVKR